MVLLADQRAEEQPKGCRKAGPIRHLVRLADQQAEEQPKWCRKSDAIRHLVRLAEHESPAQPKPSCWKRHRSSPSSRLRTWLISPAW